MEDWLNQSKTGNREISSFPLVWKRGKSLYSNNETWEKHFCFLVFFFLSSSLPKINNWSCCSLFSIKNSFYGGGRGRSQLVHLFWAPPVSGTKYINKSLINLEDENTVAIVITNIYCGFFLSITFFFSIAFINDEGVSNRMMSHLWFLVSQLREEIWVI